MFQITDETIVRRHKNGLSISASQKNHSVLRAQQLLNLPFNSYFLDHESRLVQGNDWIAKTHHLDSLSDIIGRDISYYIPNKNEARRIINNDQFVRDNKLLQFLNEKYFVEDGEVTSYISLKMPVYNAHSQLIGVFGCSKLLNNGLHEAIDFLNTLTQAEIISLDQHSTLSLPLQSIAVPSPRFNEEAPRFTPRETELIQYLVKGRTAKTIAGNLGISMRTVEAHINSLRRKASVRSKAELIEKLLHSLY